MIQERLGELRADEGKLLHKIGTDVYRKRVLITAAVTAGDWEEVDAEPPYTQAEYEAKVARLVRERYTADEEFALQRKAIAMQTSGQADEGVIAEFRAYCDYVEGCKARAREWRVEESDIDSDETENCGGGEDAFTSFTPQSRRAQVPGIVEDESEF